MTSEASLTTAATLLKEALAEAQANLMEATGSTLSSTELEKFTTKTANATTKATSGRQRMRGFNLNWKA